MIRRLPLLAVLVVLAACAAPEQPVPPPPELRLEAVAFAELDGWAGDDHAAALDAFRISCAAIMKRNASEPMGGNLAMGRTGDWFEPCLVAAHTQGSEATTFFQTWFRPWVVLADTTAQGLFTGYYEPLLEGALQRGAENRYPVYGRPADMVVADLGLFAEDLAGRSVTGMIEGGKLVPYHDRGAIDGGALDGKGLEIAWVSDPIALFFLHIQGSGRIGLADGSELRVGYDGQNGRPYYAIGRELVAMGELAEDEVSLQSIRAWLVAHPDEAGTVMATNASYVFFRVLEGPGPLGAQGVPLTAGRSLAVDRDHIALGVPLWVDTTLADGTAWRRLMIAQDTGGAIDGPVRGDIFFGAGAEAEWQAGHLRSRGSYAVLLPHLVSDQLVASR